jgi:Hydantoinase B/oxoprolinase
MIRDAVTFEVFRNAVTGLADEMAITIVRTAHSQLVASSMDFSAALCDAHGRVIAQANTLPLHLGSIPGAMEAIFDEFGDRMQPGDIYLLNDPSLGGMHLPDIFAVSPVYAGDTLLGFSVTVVNHTDVGGWSAGSMAVQSTSIFAEGVQIPPSRLVDAGTMNETFLQLILRNVREPELLLGDLESQLAACHTGAEGLRALAARHGVERLTTLIDELLDYSETLLRAALAEAVPGTYEFTDHIDDDGLGSGPIPIHVKATLSGSGTSPAPHRRSTPRSTRRSRSPAPPATPPSRASSPRTFRPTVASTGRSRSSSPKPRSSTASGRPRALPAASWASGSSTRCSGHWPRCSPPGCPQPETAVPTGSRSVSSKRTGNPWCCGIPWPEPGARVPIATVWMGSARWAPT